MKLLNSLGLVAALSVCTSGLAAAQTAGPAATPPAAATPAQSGFPTVTILPPLAETPAATPAAAAKPAAALEEKLVCKRQEVIGSLIQKRRVCMTARNWALHEKIAQDELQEFTKPGAFSPN